jgi:hypothetical protein
MGQCGSNRSGSAPTPDCRIICFRTDTHFRRCLRAEPPWSPQAEPSRLLRRRRKPTMHRRGFMAAAASTLARPAPGATSKTLSCVPRNALNSIDPILTTAQIARNMGFMVFDMLYGRDEHNVPRPRMIESGLSEDGAKRWTLRLRDGLRWHDGEKVLSRDCAAPLRRPLAPPPCAAPLRRRANASRTRPSTARLRRAALHSAGRLPTNLRLARQFARHPQRPIHRVLECQQELKEVSDATT